jgi:type II secretory pathway predicted ATPase ExeA/transposase-like protein
MRLARLLAEHGISRRALARRLDVAPSTVTHWFAQGEPRRPAAADHRTVTDWLIEQGVPARDADAWDQAPETSEPAAACTAAGSEDPRTDQSTEDSDMLLRRQPLHQATRKHFGLRCDPFERDLETADDVYQSADIRYVTQAMWAKAAAGGLLAVIGESGSGKTTILDAMEDRILQTGAPLILVRPAVAGMEPSDGRGQVLRVGHIQEAVIHALDPTAALKQSPQARAEQMRRLLISAIDAGRRTCVAIDEAHRMPEATLRHLKRLVETKRGFLRLLSIIILGQPELATRLSERNPELREVVQRCEVVTLDPLDDSLDAYLRHKLAPAGVALEQIIDRPGLDALADRLGVRPLAERRRDQPSRAYPLAAANLLAAALNLHADTGAPAPVSAATIRRV